MIGGAGHANDGHFNDDDGWYGLATINVTRQLDETSRLHVGLSYHGNRLILPDIPLPYITYTHRDDQVTYAIGLPSTWVAWTAVENLTVEAAYLFPMDGEVRVEYRLSERFSIFAEYLATTDGWSIDGVDHRRMFYEFHRASAGVRWVSRWIDASLGIGYAFDQRFETGFDVRDTTHIVALEDEPLVSLRLTGTF